MLVNFQNYILITRVRFLAPDRQFLNTFEDKRWDFFSLVDFINGNILVVIVYYNLAKCYHWGKLGMASGIIVLF